MTTNVSSENDNEIDFYSSSADWDDLTSTMSSDEYGSSSKRTRASGEVLDYLLLEFENNHNPSPEQRKEISDRTNMTEKAVRIWFQNRRAKLRKFERMGRGSAASEGGKRHTASIHSSRSNSFNEPNRSPGRTLTPTIPSIPIEINEKYCFIDCSSLSVGSWQRIKSGYHEETLLRNNLVNLSPFTLNNIMANVDLLVLLSMKNFEINYFFSAVSNNSKILFRIFYPISSILSCSLLDNNINKENNELRISLSHQPKFSVYFFNGVNANSNQWSICDDFSEDQQVSLAYCNEGGSSIPHVLVGVKNSLQFLNSFILENNQIPHRSSNFHPHIQLSDPNNLDNEGQSTGNFQFTTKELTVWNNSDRSPLGGRDSNPSPNSMTSSNNPQSNLIPNEDDELISTNHSQESNQNYPYNDMFTGNTPDFFTTGQASENPIMHNTDRISNDNKENNNMDDDENLINSPSTNLQSYTHEHHSPFNNLSSSENFADVHSSSGNDQPFDFTIGNDFSTNDNIDNANNPPSNASSSSNQVDSFIDYNSGYH